MHWTVWCSMVQYLSAKACISYQLCPRMGGSGGEAVCSVHEHEMVVGRRGGAVGHVSSGVGEGLVVPVKGRNTNSE